ncbi:MAG: MipA/OmpV family protein [Colwellia sp.]|nr:MipA/OmpV family protein [Colwellia sp.]
MLFKKLIVLIFLLSANLALANEKESTTTQTPDSDFSWQFMINMAAVYDPVFLKDVELNGIDDFLAFSLSLDLYYKGFYIQSSQRRLGSQFYSSEIGYQLINKDDWAIDILTKSYISGYSPKYLIEDQDKPIPTLDGLNDRDSGNGIAIRYSRFIDNDLFSVEFASLGVLSRADGWLIDSFYSHLIQYRNWDIYLGGGATFYSSRVIDYYLGVDLEEANEYRPEHQADGAMRLQAEIFAQHPISENWSFSAGITQNYYSNSVLDSPLADKQYITQILIGVMYVF